MLNKVIVGPEVRKATGYALTGLAKIGAISAVSVFSGRVLKEAVSQYTLGVLAHAENVKEAFRR